MCRPLQKQSRGCTYVRVNNSAPLVCFVAVETREFAVDRMKDGEPARAGESLRRSVVRLGVLTRDDDDGVDGFEMRVGLWSRGGDLGDTRRGPRSSSDTGSGAT